MKSLITGINGFVGRHLANHLLGNKHEVFGFDRVGTKLPKCTVYPCDLLDNKKVNEIVGKTSPDYIFHMAAQSSVMKSWSEPELTKKINVEGTKNLLESALKHSPKAKILIVSSGEVYGIQKEFPINESAYLNPISPYAESRVEQESLSSQYAKKGMHIVVSRSFQHTGPGQPDNFACSSFAKQIVEIENKKKKIVEVGNLAPERDFSDVRDIVKAYLLALEKCPSGVYNICSGKSYSIREILKMLIGNKKIRIAEKEGKVRKVDIPKLVGNNSKFRNHAGWKPEIPMKKTLNDLLDYWRERV